MLFFKIYKKKFFELLKQNIFFGKYKKNYNVSENTRNIRFYIWWDTSSELFCTGCFRNDFHQRFLHIFFVAFGTLIFFPAMIKKSWRTGIFLWRRFVTGSGLLDKIWPIIDFFKPRASYHFKACEFRNLRAFEFLIIGEIGF